MSRRLGGTRPSRRRRCVLRAWRFRHLQTVGRCAAPVVRRSQRAISAEQGSKSLVLDPSTIRAHTPPHADLASALCWAAVALASSWLGCPGVGGVRVAPTLDRPFLQDRKVLGKYFSGLSFGVTVRSSVRIVLR